MIQRRGVEGPPVSYLADGVWPDGELVADAPPAARYVAHIARQLRAALEGHTLSELSRRADVNRSTIQDLLAGRFWPDVVTLAKLEQALGATLWPHSPDDLA